MADKSVVITKNEAWKILDAIEAYQKNYALSGSINKTFDNIIKKLKEIIN
jgi:hypothetical protein